MIRPEDDFERLALALRRAPEPPPAALDLALDRALAAYDALPSEAAPAPPEPPLLSRLWQALQRPGGMAGAALVAGMAVVAVGPALRDPAPAPVPMAAPPAAEPEMAAPLAAPQPALRKAAPSGAAPESADSMATSLAAPDAWQALAAALDSGTPPDPAEVNAADLALVLIDPAPVAAVLLPSPFADLPVLALRPPGAPGPAAAVGRTGWSLHPQAEGPADPRPALRFVGGAAGVALALQAEGFPLAPALTLAESAARAEDAAHLDLLRRWAAFGK